MIGVDSIVGAPTDQAEGDDVLVGIEMVSDGLVELACVRTSRKVSCMIGSILRWVAY